MSALNRPPRSAAEVAALEALDSTQRLAFVRERGSSLAAETLVYLMRLGYAERDTVLLEMAAKELLGHPDGAGNLKGGHCEPIIGSIARTSFPQNARDRQTEFRQRCLAAALLEIRAGAETKHYWEERFGAAFRTKCIDVRRKLHNEERREVLGSELRDDDEDAWAESVVDPRSDDSVVLALHHLLRTERDAALWQAVNALPPRQREALLLRYREQLPIAGAGPRTICSVMRISEANGHKLLNKALARLRKNPELNSLWRDGA